MWRLRIALTFAALALSPLAVSGQVEADAPEAQAATAGQEFASAEEGARFFEMKIRPLLAAHCYACHGEETQESSLRLDTWAGLRDGGGTGKVLLPGQPDRSLLISAVRFQNEQLQMPPDGKLPEADIAALEKWIAGGAPHPDADSTADAAPRQRATSDHWAFRSLSDVQPPQVADAPWPQSPIDQFVLKRLEDAGLRPAPAADRRALIRRVTFDLTGLPPTTDEVEAFIADAAPNAFEKVVDRLLASPQYGERWGRHWLDVARYADSNGLDENIAHGNAWRYRDWVIAALNADQPYDQFVTAQLAGDLLPASDEASRYAGLIATGFLSLGPKVLAEVDKQKMEMDIIDEQLDTLGRSLLGLTLGCARCHDHKFDPISAQDYYALAGIFKSTRTMETFTTIARWWENEIPTPAERTVLEGHQQQINGKKQELDSTLAAATEQLTTQLGPGAAMPEKPEEHFPEATKQQLKALRDEIAKLEKERPVVSGAMGVREGPPTHLAVHLRGSHLSLGETVQRGFPEVLTPEGQVVLPEDQSGRLQLAQWITSADNPLTARVMVNRIWRWHFGRGLVSSPDNFGQLGDRPSHPELLDWLANRFMADGWSLKKMHRLLVLSSTYQMSSEIQPAAMEVDPGNLLMWRAPLRRLEAESLRDALLVVSRQLDTQMGGSLLHVKNREFFFDHTSKDTTNYDSRRRSVYLPVVRNNMYDGFTLFDYTDAAVPTGDRPASIVPTQALFVMNSELVERAASEVAGQLAALQLSDADRIGQLFQRALARMPSDSEQADMLASLEQLAALHGGKLEPALARERAWQTLCHAVLASNEFLYLR